MLDNLSTDRKVVVSVVGFLVILLVAGTIIGSVDESGGRRVEDVRFIREEPVDLAGKAITSIQSQDEAVSVLMNDIIEAAERAEEIHRRERESDKKGGRDCH